MKFFNDTFDFRIGKQRKIGRQTEPPVQNRMPKQDLRLRLVLRIRLRVAPRMRKLQPNEQIFIGASRNFVFSDERRAQACQARARMLRNDKLIRIRAAAETHGDGLAAPN